MRAKLVGLVWLARAGLGAVALSGCLSLPRYHSRPPPRPPYIWSTQPNFPLQEGAGTSRRRPAPNASQMHPVAPPRLIPPLLHPAS